jgi:hypothetical protein
MDLLSFDPFALAQVITHGSGNKEVYGRRRSERSIDCPLDAEDKNVQVEIEC